MPDYSLKLRISPSDNEFKKLIILSEYNTLRDNTFASDKLACRGCGYRPFDESLLHKALGLHVESIDAVDLLNSPCATLCKACHTTQHIDVAVKKGWVELVNSSYSQKRLIEMCRINSLQNSANADNIRHLKINPEKFIQSIIEDTISPNSKAKVIFTSAFEWGDL